MANRTKIFRDEDNNSNPYSGQEKGGGSSGYSAEELMKMRAEANKNSEKKLIKAYTNKLIKNPKLYAKLKRKYRILDEKEY